MIFTISFVFALSKYFEHFIKIIRAVYENILTYTSPVAYSSRHRMQSANTNVFLDHILGGLEIMLENNLSYNNFMYLNNNFHSLYSPPIVQRFWKKNIQHYGRLNNLENDLLPNSN